jgi:two-component system chemotaxis response regulator CheB
MGLSAGGLEALKVILPPLAKTFPLPLIVVQHRDQSPDDFLAASLGRLSALKVKEAEDKEPIRPGHIYLAPGGYHLHVEPDHTFSLSVDPRVNFACPSIDVLFESAADAFGSALIGVVLTGANADGAQGLRAVKRHGGLAIVQDPATALAAAMPRAALAAAPADHVVTLPQLAPLLTRLGRNQGEPHAR